MINIGDGQAIILQNPDHNSGQPQSNQNLEILFFFVINPFNPPRSNSNPFKFTSKWPNNINWSE